MKIFGIIAGVVLAILLGFAGVYFFLFHPALSADISNPPQFIQHDFVNLDDFVAISKYRSGEGHDFSGNGETCRSMKHYFTQQFDAATAKQFDKSGQVSYPTPDEATGIKIYSPVDGTLARIDAEHTPIGKQLYVRPSSTPGYSVRLFHVYPDSDIKAGMKVTAGQRLGLINKGQGTDIAVEVNTLLKHQQYLSYFQVMPDSVFAAYQARGATSRDDFIISKEYRDAHPLSCNGEEFAQNYSGQDPASNEVHLSGYIEQNTGEQKTNTNQQSGNANTYPDPTSAGRCYGSEGFTCPEGKSCDNSKAVQNNGYGTCI